MSECELVIEVLGVFHARAGHALEGGGSAGQVQVGNHVRQGTRQKRGKQLRHNSIETRTAPPGVFTLCEAVGLCLSRGLLRILAGATAFSRRFRFRRRLICACFGSPHTAHLPPFTTDLRVKVRAA